MICPHSARVSGLYHQRGFPLVSKTITQGRLSAGFEKVTTKSPGDAGRSDSNRQDGKSAGRATRLCSTSRDGELSSLSVAPPQAATESARAMATRRAEKVNSRFIAGAWLPPTARHHAGRDVLRSCCFGTGRVLLSKCIQRVVVGRGAVYHPDRDQPEGEHHVDQQGRRAAPGR